jgi:toxoflavin synthase
MNDYNKLSDNYVKTNGKPDKHFSMLPTAINILGPLKGKKVIDVGCGDGFFTREFEKDASKVIGIDNSKEQIIKAIASKGGNVDYILADMNTYNYTGADIVFAPFVLNYLDSVDKMKSLFERFYEGMASGGRVVGIVDMPLSTLHEMRKFGAVKKIAKLEEGQPLEIELYNGEEHLVTLHSFYHTKRTLRTLLEAAGFKNIRWEAPLISEEGREVMGEEFWEGYLENCDVAYFSASK